MHMPWCIIIYLANYITVIFIPIFFLNIFYFQILEWSCHGTYIFKKQTISDKPVLEELKCMIS